jgi:hypothetical protein
MRLLAVPFRALPATLRRGAFFPSAFAFFGLRDLRELAFFEGLESAVLLSITAGFLTREFVAAAPADDEGRVKPCAT